VSRLDTGRVQNPHGPLTAKHPIRAGFHDGVVLEPTIARLECCKKTGTKLRKAIEATGIEFIEENGGGPGVRLQKRPKSAQ